MTTAAAGHPGTGHPGTGHPDTGSRTGSRTGAGPGSADDAGAESDSESGSPAEPYTWSPTGSRRPGWKAQQGAMDRLVRRAQRGDRLATEELLAQTRVIAHRYSRVRLSSYAGGMHTVDDVAQDICLAVLAGIPGYRDHGRPFEAFVYGIAAHKVVDAQRRMAKAPRVVDDLPDDADDAPTPEERAVANAELAHAAHLLQQLPDRLRDVVVLRVGAGLSADETGRWLGMSPGSVRVSQHRALNRLRELAMAAVAHRGRAAASPD